METGSPDKNGSYTLLIKGLVQGVGFRPFIYRLAAANNFKGTVENRNDGVYIRVNGRKNEVNDFAQQIKKLAPPVAIIRSVDIIKADHEAFGDFRIINSASISEEVTQVSPDIAVCDECLEDMRVQEHRTDYPFINCTNCGPRFSIVQSLPYDRPFTTMKSFIMCDTCQREYQTISDRRFHAQPVACNSCGPVYRFKQNDTETTNIHEIIERLARGVDSGKVYAIKGTGGFHLMCDALNSAASNKIRELKNRDGKPFAIMAASVEHLKQIADLNESEEKLLFSWRRPIVLLKYKGGLSKTVTNGLNRVGVMLPYMPLHHQLFEQLKTPFIVLTSGNISDEPIIIGNDKAHNVFSRKVDGILTYNRDIYNRVDDSVCSVFNHSAQVIRRSRGFAPQPVITNLHTEGIFSAGAELVNSFCMGKGNQAIMSQYIGDLKNMETLEFYEETYHRFAHLFRFKPELIAVDLHPDYLSSKFAKQLADQLKVPLLRIQHHHAHIASAMATCQLDEEVIGISFDGIGLGTDGKIWGAEFMTASLSGFERLYHFEYMPMPGGDKASKEPWRMAIAYLYKVFGEDYTNLELPVVHEVEESKRNSIVQMLAKNINCPPASSAGRLFDAIASITGIAHFNTFQAEAPMRLESMIDEKETGHYNYEIRNENILFDQTIKQIVYDYLNGLETGKIAARFHNTIAEVVTKTCTGISIRTKLKKVVLSGGTFQNSFLTQKIITNLYSKGYDVFLPREIPVNDQGIALGQLAIAAKQREKLKTS